MTSSAVLSHLVAGISIPNSSDRALALVIDPNLTLRTANAAISIPEQSMRTSTLVNLRVVNLAGIASCTSSSVPVSSRTGNTSLINCIVVGSLGTVGPTLAVVVNRISRTVSTLGTGKENIGEFEILILGLQESNAEHRTGVSQMESNCSGSLGNDESAQPIELKPGLLSVMVQGVAQLSLIDIVLIVKSSVDSRCFSIGDIGNQNTEDSGRCGH